MREHIMSTNSKDDFVDFIIDNLTGSRKSELKLQPLQERHTRKQILDILETVKLYQRDQRQLRARKILSC